MLPNIILTALTFCVFSIAIFTNNLIGFSTSNGKYTSGLYMGCIPTEKEIHCNFITFSLLYCNYSFNVFDLLKIATYTKPIVPGSGKVI